MLRPTIGVQGSGLGAMVVGWDTPVRFVSCQEALNDCLLKAKLMACPHCKLTGTLVGHGWVKGYAERGQERGIRGRRFYCSNRFLRPGCGRTFSILLDHVLSGFVVSVCTLLRFVVAVVAGTSRKAAWEQAATGAFSVASGYRLWRRLNQAQPHLRTRLCSVSSPPLCDAKGPFAQLLAHLKSVLGATDCLFSGFQSHFQVGLFG